MKKDFPILDIEHISTDEELLKLMEEVEEFIKAIENKDKENTIEEFYDIIQVLVNLVNRYDCIDELEEGKKKHVEKLINRKWHIIKYI